MPDQQDLFWKGRSGAELRDHALQEVRGSVSTSWLQRARGQMVELLSDSPGYARYHPTMLALLPAAQGRPPVLHGHRVQGRRFVLSAG